MTAQTFEWRNKSVLVTGGTGSFGRKFIEALLKRQPRKVVIFSRDELKQHEMRQQFSDEGDSVVRYFIGDVRDGERLRRAFDGIDVVVHAAALKQVPACEYNPLEAIKTNIDGARHIVDAAIDAKVERVMALSTDKAVSPVNLYGATKLVAEKLLSRPTPMPVATGRSSPVCATATWLAAAAAWCRCSGSSATPAP